jgi:DNA-binding transcriptional ArsR family regulator
MEEYAQFGRKGVPLRTIDTTTGEIKEVKIKGLWSHFPIPAYQVLAAQKQWSAQRLLSCFVSFLGSEGLCVFPSYETISKRCGLSPNTIRKALNVLEENGFIKTFYFKEGKKDRNKYYLQMCCWDSGQMNKQASASRIPTSKCLDCGALMDKGGYGVSDTLGKVHYGCGGSVVGLKALAKVKDKKHPSA